ncbi:MAG: shikimate kinase [Acutalibacteraceae bacterium]|nr:shikimate kinase [Acutalibacteraceae bacterium]
MEDRIYGLLGRKLGHSYSPAIHAQLGDAAYRCIELEPDQLGEFLKRDDIGGLNVTIPYKRDVLPFCTWTSESVRQIGAANTLVKRDGKLYAYNTDKPGFMEMTRRSGISVEEAKVLVLGSGGASLAVKAGLSSMGAAQIITISRSGENNYDNISRHYDADVIVNTTPVGMCPKCIQSPLSLQGFRNLRGVLDVVYNPARTGLMLQAEELGIPHASGLTMLVAQAIRSHEIFFDTEVPDEMTDSILRTLRSDSFNIILAGMPGYGKTTVAGELGRLTGREVIDMDEEVVKAAGKSIPDIFQDDGEKVFRDMESEQIARFGAMSGKILSLGGGAVLREENYAPLHQNGRIYFLQRDLSLLGMDGRPLSKDAATLENMYKERLPRYQRFADAEVENSGTPEETARTILSDFQSSL